MAFTELRRFVLRVDCLAKGSIAFATLSTAILSSSLYASVNSRLSNLFATWFVSYRKIGICFFLLASCDSMFIIK